MKRTIALPIPIAAATSVLNTCVVVPAGGYYDRPHYYHPHYHGC